MLKNNVVNNESKALEIRKVALIKRKEVKKKLIIVAISCFSLPFLLSYIGTFLLFK